MRTPPLRLADGLIYSSPEASGEFCIRFIHNRWYLFGPYRVVPLDSPEEVEMITTLLESFCDRT